MERDELISFAQILDGIVVDNPFEDPDYTVIRHEDNQKWIALIFTLHQRLCMNLKVDPWEIDALCEQFEGISHGWHMNKRHWITIDVNSDVSIKDIQAYLKESYVLTKSKVRRSNH